MPHYRPFIKTYCKIYPHGDEDDKTTKEPNTTIQTRFTNPESLNHNFISLSRKTQTTTPTTITTRGKRPRRYRTRSKTAKSKPPQF
ncbi:hypothetical protein PCANC_07611 [Puccinia coronata f. sp. avenae]|uniref:Uncharacterized protein n=1 Tax=Puccinia coronata f. sp. avenae TaxID=200324 RepID=A0A2N5VK93_9BASI|nr:hypothetical protein PCANC_07611 [Puccinia coronata f. sp. avenae]